MCVCFVLLFVCFVYFRPREVFNQTKWRTSSGPEDSITGSGDVLCGTNSCCLCTDACVCKVNAINSHFVYLPWRKKEHCFIKNMLILVPSHSSWWCPGALCDLVLQDCNVSSVIWPVRPRSPAPFPQTPHTGPSSSRSRITVTDVCADNGETAKTEFLLACCGI